GVGNSQDDLLIQQVNREGQRAAARHSVDCVLDQIAECARKPAEVDVDVALVTNVFNELDVLARQKMERLAIQFVEQTPDRDHSLVHGNGAARVIEQVQGHAEDSVDCVGQHRA